ncbi:hypothetical protein [Shewanella algae]|uniref:hypothetical protein n=1 Tax=Shewanella algae TaxID=38313 RepID=UPI0011844727|nr:hypothetical protein [Shewanella algae]EKT4489484.1 hypothetical protein [Shewanella algae]MBO2546223.1 hypothetical protein [Shewanella algae]TVL55338.1 hypothetical protein AYJ00_04675 [Shewanella algae]HDS1199503.1 hypothetical protein [Shewanella algae]
MTQINNPVDATLVIVMLQRHLAAWHAQCSNPSQDLPIEGEQNWLPAHCNADVLRQAISDLDERIGNTLALQLVYDDASKLLLEDSLPRLVPLLAGRSWQILSYNKWYQTHWGDERLTELPARDWLAQHLLPALMAKEDHTERQRQQDLTNQEHQALRAKLQEDRQELLAENARLKVKNAALQLCDAEQLITFLPALFQQVFTLINGRELALLTGRVEPYALPNPYPEPSDECLSVLQRKFKGLSPDLQSQIVGFVAKLPQRQRLKPRPEMRELVLELEN